MKFNGYLPAGHRTFLAGKKSFSIAECPIRETRLVPRSPRHVWLLEGNSNLQTTSKMWLYSFEIGWRGRLILVDPAKTTLSMGIVWYAICDESHNQPTTTQVQEQAEGKVVENSEEKWTCPVGFANTHPKKFRKEIWKHECLMMPPWYLAAKYQPYLYILLFIIKLCFINNYHYYDYFMH